MEWHGRRMSERKRMACGLGSIVPIVVESDDSFLYPSAGSHRTHTPALIHTRTPPQRSSSMASPLHAHLTTRLQGAAVLHCHPIHEQSSEHGHATIEAIVTEYNHTHEHTHADGTTHTHWHAHHVDGSSTEAKVHEHEHALLVTEFASIAAVAAASAAAAAAAPSTPPPSMDRSPSPPPLPPSLPSPQQMHPAEASASCHQCKLKKPTSHMIACVSSCVTVRNVSNNSPYVFSAPSILADAIMATLTHCA